MRIVSNPHAGKHETQKRALKPKPTPVVAAVSVSQLNVTPVTGLDADRYVKVIWPKCPSRVRVGHEGGKGRLLLAPVHEVLAVLAAMAEEPNEVPEVANDSPKTPESVDDVLAALGRRRVAGGAR